MKKNKSTSYYMRIMHRYLGFFLAGIMTVYALSGVLLIFRETDFLKQEKQLEKKLENQAHSAEELGKALKIKGLKINRSENNIDYFQQGSYNKTTGIAVYTKKELPFILEKFNKLHKATTNQPLYWLNVFFGISLLFFAISSFWMFMPKTKTFKKGLYFTFGGIILTIILLFV